MAEDLKPLYPLRMSFEKGGAEVGVVVTREGWSFRARGDQLVFNRLDTADRLDLIGIFAEQVRLARNTPTKGDV